MIEVPADWAIASALERAGQAHVYRVEFVRKHPANFYVLILLAQMIERYEVLEAQAAHRHEAE